LGSYTNGNSRVSIYSDGTKIRETDDDEFNEVFPENIDLKITNRCDMGCPMCHENSYPDGEHGLLGVKFIDTLRPHTEISIGGGNALCHPQLTEFLIGLKQRQVIANLTVNQVHFMKHLDYIQGLVFHGLIHGIGVSLTDPTDEFIKTIQTFKNAVIHVINGVVTYGQLERLADKDLKLLILGYKDFRRGVDYKQTA
jgi:molybdenum cofactor biosynthesis enzyme MoaA